MAPTDSRLRVTHDDGVTLVEFVDRNILDEANIQQIGEEISNIIEAGPTPSLVMSFSNVDQIGRANV